MNTYRIDCDTDYIFNLPFDYVVSLCVVGIRNYVSSKEPLVRINNHDTVGTDCVFALVTNVACVNDAVRVSIHTLRGLRFCSSYVGLIINANYDLTKYTATASEIHRALMDTNRNRWPVNEQQEAEARGLLGDWYPDTRVNVNRLLDPEATTNEAAALMFRRARAQNILNPILFMSKTITINDEPVFLTLQQLRDKE